MTDPTYGRAEVEPKPQRWAYDEDGMLINVGHSQNVDYLRNRGEDYGVMYDSRGRISKVLYPGENNQPVMEVEYQYNDGGQITKIIARDLTKGAVTDIYCMEYGYDANGRKVRQVIKEKEADADTAAYYVTSFNYDARDMLTEEKYLRWDNTNSVWKVMYWGRYNYDTAGNMVMRTVEQIVNGAQKIYVDNMFSYSRGYELKSFQRLALADAELRTYNLTYDANGNVTHIQRQQGPPPFTDSFYEITEMEFDYDAKNRLVKYRFGGAGSWYDIKYDALGRVRERVDLTPTTTKYYCDGRELVQQLDNSNNVQFDYLRGPTGLDRQWNEGNDTRRFFIKDNLGTVWAMVNPSDLSVKRYNYNAWGEHLDKDDTDFPTDTNYMRYIGCRVEAFGKGTTTQRDAIYHLDHRHYLLCIHALLQRDPKDLNVPKYTSNSPYSYCYHNPSGLFDPSGLAGVYPELCTDLCPSLLATEWFKFNSCGHIQAISYLAHDWPCYCCSDVFGFWNIFDPTPNRKPVDCMSDIYNSGCSSREQCCFGNNFPTVEIHWNGIKIEHWLKYIIGFPIAYYVNSMCCEFKKCLCAIHRNYWNKGILPLLAGMGEEAQSNAFNCLLDVCSGKRKVIIDFGKCGTPEEQAPDGTIGRVAETETCQSGDIVIRICTNANISTQREWYLGSPGHHHIANLEVPGGFEDLLFHELAHGCCFKVEGVHVEIPPTCLASICGGKLSIFMGGYKKRFEEGLSPGIPGTAWKDQC